MRCWKQAVHVRPPKELTHTSLVEPIVFLSCPTSSYLHLIITQNISPCLKYQGLCDHFCDPNHAQTYFGKSSTYFSHMGKRHGIVLPSPAQLSQNLSPGSLSDSIPLEKQGPGIIQPQYCFNGSILHPHRNWRTGNQPTAFQCLNTGFLYNILSLTVQQVKLREIKFSKIMVCEPDTEKASCVWVSFTLTAEVKGWHSTGAHLVQQRNSLRSL